MHGRTVTTTREYDEQGRVVKETTVEMEWPEPVRDSGQWWQPQPNPWWQYPTVTYTGSNTTDRIILMNGSGN